MTMAPVAPSLTSSTSSLYVFQQKLSSHTNIARTRIPPTAT
jgi:hypothetical protein